MTADVPALVVEHLFADYGGAPVLRDVSVRLEAHEVCAVLGPNGAGKSTLLRSVMGLTPHVVGNVRHRGSDLARVATHDRADRGIAYVPEGRGILNSLTTLENLHLGARVGRRGDRTCLSREARIEKVLERFPVLRSLLGRRAGLLSGGEQQMLAIARALAGEPEILLIDEPSLGLAPRIRQELGSLIGALAVTDGVSVLIAEQDLGLASTCASRAYVMRLGNVVAEIEGREIASAEQIRQMYFGA